MSCLSVRRALNPRLRLTMLRGVSQWVYPSGRPLNNRRQHSLPTANMWFSADTVLIYRYAFCGPLANLPTATASLELK